MCGRGRKESALFKGQATWSLTMFQCEYIDDTKWTFSLLFLVLISVGEGHKIRWQTCKDWEGIVIGCIS